MTYVNISQNEYGEKIKKSSLITLGVVLFLIIIKALAYFATGSIIILSLICFYRGNYYFTNFNIYTVYGLPKLY